ncbi:polymeric immunoglobulin receptor-like isoform X1 [Brienomyrus brachyistius]|uniref:polymeric immunoglobulin receptor-like isoform X1 n=1 Tax=Brienomyrus brachyistius TaxID=42636 RepID=UPI0020B24190|nr:polymeric immunoglobulin receptor-like isoform X1 [Brienomyrus brachyistius]
MAPLLFLVFIGSPVINPAGSSKVKTFEKLTALAGGSISIPCFYGQEHKDGVKSWCKGKDASSCSTETRSDSPPAMNRVSIADDPQNLVFIVTMRNLQHTDSGSYWCCVDDGCRRSEDSSGNLELVVSTEVQSVRTVSWVSAERGGSVTIPCYYHEAYESGVKSWCKGDGWDSCSRTAQSDRTQDGGKVSVSEKRDQRVFYVSMRDLQEGDSGNYWCEVKIGETYEKAFLPLMVQEANVATRKSKVVTFKKLTGEIGGSITIPCFYGQEHKNAVKSWCKGNSVRSCSNETRSDPPLAMNRVFITDDHQNLVFIVTMRNLQQSDSGYYWCAVGGGQGRPEDSSGRLTFTIRADVTTVRTVSWVSAERGGSVTIPCYYNEYYKSAVKSWSRGDECSSILAQSNREQSGGKVSITDDRDQSVFYVTMRNLQEEDSGYYSCCVGGLFKASLSLIVREEIHVPTTQQTEQNRHTTMTTAVASPFPLTSNSTAQNVTNSVLSDPTLPFSVGILAVLLLLMLLLIAVVTILCRRSAMALARNRNRENTAAPTPSVDPGDEVTYISVTTKARNLAHSSIQVMPLENMTSADPDVTYSNTTTQRKKAAADPHEVVYSTVARR